MPTTKWKPGVSGNPSGKPKASADARAMARELLPDVFKALRSAIKRPGPERQPACRTILEYAVGKPATNATTRVIVSVQDLTEDELLAIAGETEESLLLEAAPEETEDETDD